jgi:CRP/FNR family cyclic AMP-dependent transcriptional regulator
MASSQRLDTKLDCLTCDRKRAGFLCQLSPKAFEEFLAIRHNLKYPAGTILFLEKEQARGLLLLCSGNVKLSFSSSTGKTLVLRIAKPGDVLGLSAVMSDNAHEVTAEVLQPVQMTLIHKEDFLRFIRTYPEVYGAVIGQISAQYTSACEQLRTVGLSTSANQKLARLLLDWSSDGVETREGTQIRVPWTHDGGTYQRPMAGQCARVGELYRKSSYSDYWPSFASPSRRVGDARGSSALPADSALETAEREHILRVLRETNGVVGGPDGAAAKLGVKRTTLNSKLKKLGIERSDYV